MASRHTIIRLSYILVLSSTQMTAAWADESKDKEECAEQLAGLATCLPYVEGQAKAPTPDCCSGLKQVLKNDKKCLCVIIKDRNDPELGLQINATLALSLPSICNAPANVSKCPELLHMDPKSPEAQVFYQLGQKSNAASSPAPSPDVEGSPQSGKSSGAGTSGETAGAPAKNDACHRMKCLMGLKGLVGMLVIWSGLLAS